MAVLRLADVDRAALDVPEAISFRPGRWSMRSIGALRKQTGYTLDRLEAGMDGFPVVQPDGSEAIERDFDAWAAYFWLILWDAGHRVSWDGFDLRGFPKVEADPEGDDADMGKATPTDSLNDNTNSSSYDTSQE